MKKYIICVLLFFLMFILLFNVAIASDKVALLNKTIVIDPGHGGIDPGAVVGDIYEKNINLNISKYLKKYLEYYGAKVLMIRNDDYDLSKPNAIYRKKSDFDNRINMINHSNADIYLSIHLNYLSDSRYSGPQVFYGDKLLADSIKKSLGTNRKNKQIPSSTYMYDKLNVDGVLIECGFLSNSVEKNKLITKEYQKEIAKKIALGVISYYNM